MAFGIIAFIIGIATIQWFVELPSLGYCLLMTLASLSFCLFRNHVIRKFALLLFAFFLGITWADYQARRALSLSFPAKDFGKIVTVTGWVASIPKKTPLGLQFQFRLKQIDDQKKKSLIQLTWYSRYGRLQVGDEWRLPLKLKHIHGLSNPEGFDYERWAFQQGIHASGYVINRKQPHFIQQDPWRFPITHYRESVQAVIQSTVKDPTFAGILSALSIGSKHLMSSDTWRVFQRTGTSHLVAISGLHVGLVAVVVYFLMSWIWRLFPWLLLRIPAQRAGAFAAIVISWLYGLLVGFSLPTQRAVIMVTVLMLSQLFSRNISLWHRLLLAFAIIVFYQPLALFSASLWLSFSAVFWIAYIMLGRRQGKSKIIKGLRLQCGIFFGLMPLTLYYFGKISLVSFFANAIAIPWVTMVVVPVCLLASFFNLISTSISSVLFMLAWKLIMPLWRFLHWLAHFSLAVWIHPINSIVVLLTMIAAMLLLLAPKGFPARYLGFLGCIPFFFYRPASPMPDAVWLHLLDVGQGLSAVVRTAHHVLIYDTGPRTPNGFNAGRSVVTPYLQNLGIQQIDTLMISHADNDHMGGAPWLLAAYPVQKVITSVPQRRWSRSVIACYAGQMWRWDGVDFHVLSPPKKQPYQDNNSSCVLMIQTGGRRILLTGDIEKPIEQSLLVHQKKQLSATVLVVPHHGSRSSSSPAFVKAVHARYVLIPAGYGNRYHFPAKSVLRRYQDTGAQIFSTSRQGAIRIQMSPAGQIRVTTSYHRHHYWQN